MQTGPRQSVVRLKRSAGGKRRSALYQLPAAAAKSFQSQSLPRPEAPSTLLNSAFDDNDLRLSVSAHVSALLA